MQNPHRYETNPKFSSGYMNGRGQYPGTNGKNNVTDLKGMTCEVMD
jgi:hypothetical protein